MEISNKINTIINNKIEENKNTLNIINELIVKYNNSSNKNEKKNILFQINKLKNVLIDNVYIINYNDKIYNFGDNINDNEEYNNNYKLFKYLLLNEHIVDNIEYYLKKTFNDIDKKLNIDKTYYTYNTNYNKYHTYNENTIDILSLNNLLYNLNLDLD